MATLERRVGFPVVGGRLRPKELLSVFSALWAAHLRGKSAKSGFGLEEVLGHRSFSAFSLAVRSRRAGP